MGQWIISDDENYRKRETFCNHNLTHRMNFRPSEPPSQFVDKIHNLIFRTICPLHQIVLFTNRTTRKISLSIGSFIEVLFIYWIQTRRKLIFCRILEHSMFLWSGAGFVAQIQNLAGCPLMTKESRTVFKWPAALVSSLQTAFIHMTILGAGILIKKYWVEALLYVINNMVAVASLW